MPGQEHGEEVASALPLQPTEFSALCTPALHVVLPKCIGHSSGSHQELQVLLFPARCLKWLHDDVNPDLHVPLALLCCVTVEQWKHFLGFKALCTVPHPWLWVPSRPQPPHCPLQPIRSWQMGSFRLPSPQKTKLNMAPCKASSNTAC